MKNSIPCPICKQTLLQDFEICKICFWEFDLLQYEHPDIEGGANYLSLNQYKKWWDTLTLIMPQLIEEFNIQQSSHAHWKYDELIIPRENIKQFVNHLTKLNICIRASFYYLCDKYNYNSYTFVGFPTTNTSSTIQNNNEVLELIFTNDPINTCKKYHLKQILEILHSSQNPIEIWEQITPHICINPNPKFLPTPIKDEQHS